MLIYLNSSSDPYSNGNAGAMIDQNQDNIDDVIGNDNYDIGHVFGTNSGGLASLGSVCSNSQKARGITGSFAPVGDPFDIDYVWIIFFSYRAESLGPIHKDLKLITSCYLNHLCLRVIWQVNLYSCTSTINYQSYLIEK